MPDRWGFDHLPGRGVIEVRCIEEGCDTGGLLHKWPEHKRRRHAKEHGKQREAALRRQREENLREARRLKRLSERENARVYGE